MSAVDLDVFVRASADQRQATRPEQSAWVEANAGTGKTKVLTDRVTRLLLSGVRPERILCLTFTKAAAAEMRNRLATQLGAWAMADPVLLDGEIEKLIDGKPDEKQRVIARRLFARVLDAPGGINILTIHAFCQALLKRFPLEAGVAPGFEVMDEAEAATLLRQAQDAQVEALAEDGAPADLKAALATVANRVSISEYAELMTRLLSERAWLLARIGKPDGFERLRRRLARHLRCDQPLDSKPDEAALRLAATALLKGGKQDAARGRIIADWLASGDQDTKALATYATAFFTTTGDIRKTLASKAAVAAMPGIVDVLEAEAERLDEALNHARGCALVDLTLALLRLGLDITKRYDAAKRRRAALDYDDLIVATRRLLESAESAAWVLYKLDGGIDHVLVDEAQDTNPDQWEVIRQLTAEFFAQQAGTSERERTIFAVGDTKQSIFGFQRADPRKLAEMRGWFEDRSRQASHGFSPVDLTVSFRSTPAVLQAVDWVFDQPETARGVAERVLHRPVRQNDPGRVELWPLVQATKTEIDPTDLAARHRGEAPAERLANRIAAHAKSLIGTERRARSDDKGGELLHAGHFMVLVRRRNTFVTALVKALKREQIEVAGVDRLYLNEELAVQDLLAMARFALLPQDDLNLACLLKSPLIGLDEEQLFTLAYKRTGTLWRALRDKSKDPAFAEAGARLLAWLGRADLTTPFDFFAQALGPEQGRKRLLERLGHEASDPIDELLARALQYQKTETGSLQGFLRWLEAGGSEIKRDLDANRRREVRILTVHASKGLQAPIVYLPDTTRVPRDNERLLSTPSGKTRLWLPRTDDANDAARLWRAESRDRSLEEQNRLLYVAMTRAEDRLYVAGWIGVKRQDTGCWYDRIAAGLAASAASDDKSRLQAQAKEFDFGEGWTGEGFELVNQGKITIPEQQELALDATAPLPPWLAKSAPSEPDPPQPLAPSQPLPDEAAAEPRAFSPLAADDIRRWQRGRLMHELLHHLPALPAADRPEAARRFFAQKAHGLASDVARQWAQEALAVTEAPDHAALFAEGSRAEVPLIGTVKT
ncbi:MAG TPA: double-strand break repair helicase AddA, partial [Reyranella sp.]|nr:double-strand break repair helicase AddA [Reyranella sp.]